MREFLSDALVVKIIVQRCGMCGKDNCNVNVCKVEKEQATCLHNEGNYGTGCPVKEEERGI